MDTTTTTSPVHVRIMVNAADVAPKKLQGHFGLHTNPIIMEVQIGTMEENGGGLICVLYSLLASRNFER